ncbi:hypothetical protein [Streptomyces sp. NPDC002537]
MRVQLIWPNLAVSCLPCPSVTFVVPDVPCDAFRPVLRWALAHAEPVLGSAADAAGAGLAAQLLLRSALRLLLRALDGPERGAVPAPAVAG